MSGRSTFADRISGREATERVATDCREHAGKKSRALGTNVQQRTPIMSDPRVAAAAWVNCWRRVVLGPRPDGPRHDAEQDRLPVDRSDHRHSRTVHRPLRSGFDFVDVDLLGAPRYANGRETHGGTLVEYKTNGEQLYTRQADLVGDTNWGAAVDYGFRTGNDYTTGDPDFELPSSYRSGDLNAVSAGIRLT